MNKPIVFYSVSFAIGCISSLLFVNNLFLGAVLAASFLLIIFYTCDKRYFLICTMFLLVAIISFQIYFNGVTLSNKESVRIVQKKEYYSLGEYKGRKVTLKGELSKFEEGEKVFFYGKFTGEKDFERGIVGVFEVKEGKKEKKDIISYIYSFKRDIYKRFKTNLGEEKAALVTSLCYGDTKELSKEQKDEFNKLGVIHAVSVSGFHMAIIYKMLECTLGLELAIVISFVYTFFTGFQASTLRAFIMILIFKCSKKVCKNYDKLSSLSLAAIILLAVKPYYIVDLGFLLSFLSTLGIILFYNKIKKLLYSLPVKINESISVALSAQLLSMPYVAMTLNNFSPGFLLGNFVLLPLYTVIVVLGNCVLLFIWCKPIFNFFCFLLNIILTSINGANYLLMKVCPPIVYFNYWEGAAIALTIMCYFLVKAGYKKFLYLPIFLLLTVVIQYYSFLPELRYLGIQGEECVILRYKTEAILFCKKKPEADLNELKKRYRVNKIIDNANKGCRVDIGNNSFAAAANNFKDLNIELFVQGRRYVFLKNTQPKNLDYSYKCDIIKVPERKYRITRVYSIVFGDVYVVNY